MSGRQEVPVRQSVSSMLLGFQVMIYCSLYMGQEQLCSVEKRQGRSKSTLMGLMMSQVLLPKRCWTCRRQERRMVYTSTPPKETDGHLKYSNTIQRDRISKRILLESFWMMHLS